VRIQASGIAQSGQQLPSRNYPLHDGHTTPSFPGDSENSQALCA